MRADGGLSLGTAVACGKMDCVTEATSDAELLLSNMVGAWWEAAEIPRRHKACMRGHVIEGCRSD